VSDGEAFLEEQLARVREQRAAGRGAVAVFDLDNTLFDTRTRTLAIARAFDAARGSAWFAQLGVDEIRLTGAETARAAGAPDALVTEFQAHWDVAFWSPEAFVHDLPIDANLRWVAAAQAAGAETRFLTGRIQTLHAASVTQLRRADVVVEEAQVVCKPDLDHYTPRFKADVLRGWMEERFLAWFVSDGRRDLAFLDEELPDLPLVPVPCSLEEGSRFPLPSSRPRMPTVF
jgi:phosphoserine phosphatase